jgi:hypothetical protein
MYFAIIRFFHILWVLFLFNIYIYIYNHIYMVVFLFNTVIFIYFYCIYVFLLLCLIECLCIICMFMYLLYVYRASWHSSATLTEVLPCFFLGCKANARVKPAKMGHVPHFSKLFWCCICIVCFVLFCVLFVCKCVLY